MARRHAYRDKPDRRRAIADAVSSSTVALLPAQSRWFIHLVRPDGFRFDVSDRLAGGTLGLITEATEEDILELTHGDVDLTLDDVDGAVSRFLERARVDGLADWTVVIDRDRPDRRSMKRDRVFAGILDMPWSLQYDRHARLAMVHAFSFSKLLERASAESLARDVSAVTASVSAASNVVTVSPNTSLLSTDDRIRLRDNTNDEEQTIVKVLSASQVQTLATWTNAFAAGTPLVLTTPFPRDRSVVSLVGDLFDLAGITSRRVDILNVLSAYPIATPMNTTSFPRATTTGLLQLVKCLTQRGTNLDARSAPGGTATRAESLDPAAPWVQFTTGNVAPIQDWTAYLDSEPSNFPQTGGLGVALPYDNGAFYATDHGANILWNLTIAGGNINLYSGATLIGPLWVTPTLGHPANLSIEADPVSGDVWFSITVSTTESPGSIAGKDELRGYDGSGFVIDSAFSGKIRYLRRLRLMAVHEFNPAAGSGYNPTTNLRLYDPATRTLVRTVTIPQNLWAWSLHVWQAEEGLRIAGLYRKVGTTRLIIWDSDWSVVADYEVAGSAPAQAEANITYGYIAHLSVFTDPDGREFPVGYVGNVLFVLGKGFRGVVPYADFDGLSVGGALRELAIVSLSYFSVDVDRRGIFVGRGADDSRRRRNAVALGDPITLTEWPLWDQFRTSARVTGRDPAGQEIEGIVGDTGDSARRIEIDGKLVSSGGLAEAVGNAAVSFLSVRRSGLEGTWHAPAAGAIHVLDYVTHAGRDHLVLGADLDPADNTCGLTLAEAS